MWVHKGLNVGTVALLMVTVSNLYHQGLPLLQIRKYLGIMVMMHPLQRNNTTAGQALIFTPAYVPDDDTSLSWQFRWHRWWAGRLS